MGNMFQMDAHTQEGVGDPLPNLSELTSGAKSDPLDSLGKTTRGKNKDPLSDIGRLTDGTELERKGYTDDHVKSAWESLTSAFTNPVGTVLAFLVAFFLLLVLSH